MEWCIKIINAKNVFMLGTCSKVVSAAPHHRASSATKGKNPGDPVRRHSENETLYKTHEEWFPPRPATDIFVVVSAVIYNIYLFEDMR